MTDGDPRRRKSIRVDWNGTIGRLIVGGEFWGNVEWSARRKMWCIEDSEGACLSHHAHIHAKDKDKAGAVALAKAMIRDGRMPTPQQAAEAHKERLWQAHWAADGEQHLYEVLDAFNLNDLALWKSNSFAQLRDRLIIELRAKIIKLEALGKKDRRLLRAREVLNPLQQNETHAAGC
jgi:hypothetical protein